MRVVGKGVRDEKYEIVVYPCRKIKTSFRACLLSPRFAKGQDLLEGYASFQSASQANIVLLIDCDERKEKRLKFQESNQ